jgi:NADH:ubiquinone oxidoreductase subunit B-like Fe-S oxidoreductase
MIVAGRVSKKMGPVLRRLYDQMPEPKWVIAMGDCASCSGVFNNYAIYQGVDEIVPVDVYVAGCPPRPEALIHGVLTVYEKVQSQKLKDWQLPNGSKALPIVPIWTQFFSRLEEYRDEPCFSCRPIRSSGH